MHRLHLIGIIISGLGLGLLVAACQSQAKPTPEPTPTENVVVVVVTATNQPTLAPSETLEATITPLATFTPIGLETATATPRPTSPPTKTTVRVNTPKPVKSASPTLVAEAAATATPAPQTIYQAPQILGPAAGSSYNDGNSLVFEFRSVGPLPSNVCYKVEIGMANPNASGAGVSDDWLWNCGDPTSGFKTSFVLTKFQGQYTYATIRDQSQALAPTDLLNVKWSVTVVQDNGLGPDGVHHVVVPMSAVSQGADFVFRPH